MAEAAVGDDVLDDDLTIKRLQEKSAALLGKEDALFMPSGTMSNAVAIKVHTTPGDEVLLDADAHSMLYEAGNPATIANVLTRQFRSVRGVPCVDEIPDLIHTESLHSPRTSLLLLENSHNRAGGAVIPLTVLAAVRAETETRGVAVHLDGARLFNAASALGVEAADIAYYADTVTFCLSKGLGCPVGSVLCGPRDFILRARRVRKMLGGGLRQAGILAAAGIFALYHNLQRLSEDHDNACRLARILEGSRGLAVQTAPPDTNMVYLRTEVVAAAVAEELKVRFGVLVSCMGTHIVRMVTHMDVSGSDVERAGSAVQSVCSELSRT